LTRIKPHAAPTSDNDGRSLPCARSDMNALPFLDRESVALLARR
jgi:hypothetical protein